MLHSLNTNPTDTVGKFAGLDWGEKHHQLCLVNGIGQVVYTTNAIEDLRLRSNGLR